MNNADIDQHLEGFIDAIYTQLRSCEEGVSEYDLIQRLKAEGYFSFLDDKSRGNHALFCAHFLMFHGLYLLCDQLVQSEQGYIEISPLSITLKPYQKGEAALSHHDPLHDYYLDLDNLRNTSEQDVDELIASFWVRMGKSDQRVKALSILGLEDPVDDTLIKKTYRRLVSEHHPDRGGNHKKIQQLNWAMEQLK